MHQYENLFEFFFNNLKWIVFPEQWLALDIEMSKQELFTIMMVERFGEITMSQISDQMNFPMSTATGIIDRLVKKGYVQRDKSDTDRRIVAIVLTDKGKVFMQHMKSQISEYINRIYDVLDEEERQYLFRIFNKVSTAFQQFSTDNSKDISEQNQIKKIKIE